MWCLQEASPMMNDFNDPSAGTIYYDANCGLCTTAMCAIAPVVERRGYRHRPMQTSEAAAALALPPDELAGEVKLRLADGRILGGVDALLHLGSCTWWTFPLRLACRIPGGSRLARFGYALITRHRYAISGACGLRPKQVPCSRPDSSLSADISDAKERSSRCSPSTATSPIC
jgi:predicted DCC family thiol-disulfide oxidoreductase YuxK